MKRIQQCWHDEGQGGVSLVMTLNDEGQGPIYQVNATDGTLLARNRTEQDAKSRAAEVLKEKRHVCSPRCTRWIEIPQPEPLSETQKKVVVASFRQLQKAVDAGASHEHELTALGREYRGSAEPLLGGFDAAPDARKVLHEIEQTLKDEIEEYYWRR